MACRGCMLLLLAALVVSWVGPEKLGELRGAASPTEQWGGAGA